MKKIITILILVIPVFIIWYFYPCFTFKGTYERSWLGETQFVVIGDKFVDGEHSYDFQLKPIRRMLWVDMRLPLFDMEHYPVKLGWNKIYEWDSKSGGWDKLKKIKQPQSIKPIVKTPVESGNVQGTAAEL
jgi:hypothetical protein